MFALITRILRDNWKKVLLFSAIGLSFVWMYAAIYPSVLSQAAELNKLIDAYPPEFLKAFDVEGSVFSTFELFLSVEHFSMIWPILAIILSVSLANSLFAAEIDSKMMHLLVAQPLSRSTIFWAKVTASMLLIVIFTIASVSGIIPFAWIYGITPDVAGILTLTGLSMLFALSIFALSILFSVIATTPGMSNGLSYGTILGMYALNLFAALKENLVNLKHYSFFYYFDYKAAINEHTISWQSILVFSMTLIIGLLTAQIYFSKRDL